METRKITAPEPGQFLFSEEANLMMKVRSIGKTSGDIGVYVVNGAWTGMISRDMSEIKVDRTGKTVPLGDLVEVLSVTEEERDAWYLDDINHSRLRVGNDRTFERGVVAAKLTIAVMTDELDPEKLNLWLSEMSLADIEREMDDGSFIGQVEVAAVDAVPDAEVEGRLVAIGNDGSFFQQEEDWEIEDPEMT